MRKVVLLTCSTLVVGVGVFILTITILTLRPGLKNVFPRGGLNQGNIDLRHCKHFKQKERTNWNHLYYYENPGENTYSAANNLIWCKVPKAGSTTLTNIFLRLAGVRLTNGTKVHKILRHHYPKLREKEIRVRLKSSFKFLVVRDPFERVLSAYRDKLESYDRDLAYRNGYYFENYGRFMVAQSSNGTKTVPSWPQFIAYLLKTSTARYDEHWMPIHRLCTPCSFNYDAIIRMENFDVEMAAHLKRLDVPIQHVGWAHKTGSSNPKLIQKYYRNLTLSEVKQLYAIYKKDFQLFGYTPFKYFRMTKNKN